MTVQLRDYQIDASKAVRQSWSDGNRAVLSVMATGLGKTVFGLNEARDFPGRVLWLAHRQELVDQPCKQYARMFGEWPEVEMGRWKANKKLLNHKCHLVVGSPQTMLRRKNKWHPKDFDLVIVDEAHHYVSTGWNGVVDHFMSGNSDCRALGLTATPKRTDEVALGKLFDDALEPLDAVWGIDNGWLKPIDEHMVHVEEINLSDLKVRDGADFSDRQLAMLLRQHGGHLKAAKPIIDTGKHTIVFVPPKSANDEHGMVRELSVALNAYCEERGQPHQAFYVTCKTEEHIRESLLRQFRNGDLKYFVNVGIAGEGFDAPLIDCVASLRPTKSELVYRQMIGRGMRPLPGVVDGPTTPEERRAAIAESASPRLLVLDFVGNCGRHRTMTVVDALGGNYDDDIIKSSVEEARKAGRAVNVAKLLEWSAKKAVEEKQRQMSESARRKVTADVRYTLTKFDPFAVMGVVQEREPGWFRGQKPTDKQRDLLLRRGVEAERIAEFSKWQASKLIGELLAAQDRGEASYKQAKILLQFGELVVVNGQRRKFAEASAIITRIKDNGWRPLR